MCEHNVFKFRQDEGNETSPTFPYDYNETEAFDGITITERARGFVADHKVAIGGVIGAIGIISALKRHYKNPGHNID